MAKVFLFNPYTGTPRHPSDIASDPEGLAIVDDTVPLRAAQAATPAPALYVGLIERLMRLSTRLGIAHEGGVEHFAAGLEDRLYAICRSAEGLLDSMAATPAPAPAQAQQAEPPHLFEFWWERYMPEATQSQAWEAWQAALRADGVGVAATPAPAEPSPWGWAIVDKNGDEMLTRPRLREFFGAANHEQQPFSERELANANSEWPGLAPFSIVTLYTAPRVATPAPAEPVGTMTFTESMGATFDFKHALTIKPGDTFELLRAKQGKEASNAE